jgi:modulator of FtsH protease HflK
MYPPSGPRQPEMDFDQIMARAREAWSSINRRLGGGGVGLAVLGIIGIIAVIWLATGIYQLRPGEQAVTFRFGALCSNPVGPCGTGAATGLDTIPGLKWWWPAPIGGREVERVDLVRRMQLGFRTAETGATTVVPEEALMVSGDLNVLDVRMVVQYRIRELPAFLLRVSDPGDPARGIPVGRPEGRTLKDASEAALRLVVGQRSLGDVLAEDRLGVQLDTADRLQAILNSYNAGIRIEGVELQTVQAPQQVRDAFDDVLRARQDRERAINEARAFENRIIPEARGQAAQVLEAAHAFRGARIARATGESEQFALILDEFQQSREVTRQRLYLEAMEEILPGISKVIVSPDVQTVLLLGESNRVQPVPMGPTIPSP